MSTERHVELADRFAIIPEELLYDPEIPAEAVRVYGVLCRYGSDPSNCYPSHATIAAHIGKSARSVPAWIRTLELAGWVERFPRLSAAGDPTSNGYRVHARAVERGVRAGERGPLRAGEQGGSALDSAPKESQWTDTQPERENPRDEALGAGFDRFWSAYPRKAAKGDARKAWPAAVRAAGGMGPIIRGAEAYRDDPNRDDRFTAYPATWLRAERWSDPPLPARAGAPAPARAAIMEDRSAPEGRVEL